MDKLCFHKHARHHNRTHHGYKEEDPIHRIHKEEEEEVPTVILASNGLKVTISWYVLVSIVAALVT